MKKKLIIRTIIGSLLLGLIGPLLFKSIQNVITIKNYQTVSAHLCKIIEPQIQVGANREALEFAQATLRKYDFKPIPEIYMLVNDKLITSGKESSFKSYNETCKFKGITGVIFSIRYPVCC